jgi:hypothetical protein
MMSWAAPTSPTPPPATTSPRPTRLAGSEQDDWLKVFSRTTLPAITVHEVAPGHFAHGGGCAGSSSDVRRTLHSLAFVEGWAHYGEEVCVEEGFRADDPRFAAGVALEALQRVTRLAVSIGTHAGTMTVRRAPPASRPTPSATARPPAPRPPGPPSTPPTGATPGASWRSWPCGSRPGPLGRRLLPPRFHDACWAWRPPPAWGCSTRRSEAAKQLKG